MSLGSSISGLFGQSPIKPLQQHYACAHACATALNEFFQAVAQQDWNAATQQQQHIRELENEADELKRQFRLNMPGSLMLPLPRVDLLNMVSLQDKVANRAKDIAGLMLGRQMQLPEPLSQPMQALVTQAIDASAQALSAINELPELIESGFGGRTVTLIEQMINELDRIEQQTDEQQIAIRATLYQLEKDLPPVDVIFLYQIIDWIGDLANRAQKVGGYLHLLVAR